MPVSSRLQASQGFFKGTFMGHMWLAGWPAKQGSLWSRTRIDVPGTTPVWMTIKHHRPSGTPACKESLAGTHLTASNGWYGPAHLKVLVPSSTRTVAHRSSVSKLAAGDRDSNRGQNIVDGVR